MLKRTRITVPVALAGAAVAAFEIGEASAITIGARVPLLASMAFWPQFDVLLEAHRMVVEKMAAVFEGSLAASQATAALATKAALGRMDATDVALGIVSIAMAATRPTHRRARANATRLSRRAY
jgi:hypothetical protein